MSVMHPALAPSPPCGQVRSRLTPPRRNRFDRLCHYRNCVGFGVGSCRFPPSSSGLDPGSTAALRSWTPDQVRGDDDGKILPVAKRWGGGPSPQAMVEGQQPHVIAPPSALRAATSPWLRHREEFRPLPPAPLHAITLPLFAIAPSHIPGHVAPHQKKGARGQVLFNRRCSTDQQSEERRVGNEGVSTCRSCWSP